MILDPRLVPWGDVIPGLILAAVLAAVAFFLWRWRNPALILVAAAPVIGWALAVRNLKGSFPALPPNDTTMWVFYFVIAAVFIAAAGLYLSRYRWWTTAALLISVAYVAALWSTLVKPLAVPDESGTSLHQPTLFLAWIGCMLAIDMRKTAPCLAAEYAPWLVALVTASVCLALTGTASISTLALALCLCAIPAAIAVLLRCKHQPPTKKTNFGPLTGGSFVPGDDDTDLPLPPATPQLQVITLPLAVALPMFILSGSLYASTPWVTTTFVLLTPIVGVAGLRTFVTLRGRYDRWRHSDTPAPSWKRELLSIVVALLFAAIPAAIAAWQVISAAATEEPFY